MVDLIDRKAFKDKYICCGYIPEMSEEEFDSFPTAEFQHIKHGFWKEYNANETGGKSWVCSECGLLTYAFMFERQIAKYCPHCGAKMDGQQAD